MTKVKLAVATVMLASLALAGCSQTTGPNESGGTILGAIAGGVIGNQFGKGSGKVAATIAGTMIGGMIGSKIGRDLDEEARRQAYGAQSLALDSGRKTKWNAPSGSYGFVEPGPVYAEREQTCRSYTHTIYINGRPEKGNGTACRNQEGTWDIVN
jgi:surface antigen